MGLLGHVGRLVVADERVEGGHEHERRVQVLLDLDAVGLEALDGVLTESPTRIGQQTDRMKNVVDDHRFTDVELEIAPASGHGHGGVVPHHLDTDHDHGFALGGVDLSGHDARPRLVGREYELGQPRSGARPEPADIVGDLGEGDGQGP